MTRIAVATVLSARPWEVAFVAEAADGARVRVVARVSGAHGLARALPSADVVILGSETPWIEPWVLHVAGAFGTETIGLHPVGDRPGETLVDAASLALPDTTSAARLVTTASVLGLTH